MSDSDHNEDYEVNIPHRKKTVVYREGAQTFVFDAAFEEKSVTVFFRYCGTGRLGGEGFLTEEEKRRIAPRVVRWLRESGYHVKADGDTPHNDRWLPSAYANQ